MERLRWVRLTVILALMVMLYFAVPVTAKAELGTLTRSILVVAILCALAVGMTRQLRVHIDDATRHLDGLLASIVLVIVVFSFAFYVLELRSPGQVAGLHTRLDALYFTASTLATVGYGDVHAVGQAARALVLAQLVFNAVFVATAAGLLTSRVREAAQVRTHDRSTQRRQT